MSTKEVVDRLHEVPVDDARVVSTDLGLPPDPGERTRRATLRQHVVAARTRFAVARPRPKP